MFKKILLAVLAIYVVITSTYFIYKYAPYVEKYFKGETEEANKEQTGEEVKVQQKECPSFAIGHIAIDQFRVQTRFLASASDHDKVFQQNDLQQALATLSCDKAKQKALIYYDSKPVAIASIESFDYSKPLAENSEMKPEFYTVLKVEKKLADFLTMVTLSLFTTTTIAEWIFIILLNMKSTNRMKNLLQEVATLFIIRW
jgi:hypothetical protein